MHFTTLIVAALASTFAAAAPATPSNTKRACTQIFPAGVTAIHLAKNAAINIQQDLAFSVPAGAGGPCSLVATFPVGFSIANSGQALVDVVAVDGPAPGALVGSITFASDPVSPTFRTINSFACRPNMLFRLRISGAQGAVDFAEGNGAGVALTYSC
ncbi:hypothetical protein B0T26DRAFT_747532 [Lasiosphaeria miniovina]|uniref:Ubiquitin 3 binding protein But2 C-terminal domain-containing protein n=1 Tax=Lasiosphaeria miniovina TaxID=1954250 RepID=A0AA40E6U5_9PEZI|nr:uncharacterized protein B0T26DRAFT_747532 [Lasiosphaeria miniovina]KAK0727177.1 hypothetical protein B0T26DRAFT_747532 [Lasiosphaeria miniovina]